MGSGALRGGFAWSPGKPSRAATIGVMHSTEDSTLERALTWLGSQPDLRLALLFGSAGRDELRPRSDLDIAVLRGGPLSVDRKQALIEGLACASGRAVDLVDLATVGEPLLGRILSEGRRLFGSDEDYAALVVRDLIEKADFLPHQQRTIEERRRAWIGR